MAHPIGQVVSASRCVNMASVLILLSTSRMFPDCLNRTNYYEYYRLTLIFRGCSFSRKSIYNLYFNNNCFNIINTTALIY